METEIIVAKKKRYHHGDLKAQLIEATRRLVERKGPDNFSVSEACREAGVSTAAPYKHFRDKTEMLRAVSFQGMTRLKHRMLEAIADIPSGTPERVDALGRVYVEYAQAEPGVFRLCFALSEDPEDDTELIELGASVFGIVESAVAACLGRDSVTEEDSNRAFMLWSFVHGLSFLMIDGKVSKVGPDFALEPFLKQVTQRVLPECFEA